MQYNKYALAVALLASSAFASGAFELPKFSDIATAYISADTDGKKDTVLVDNKLADASGAATLRSTYSVLDPSALAEALKEHYYKETAKAIFDAASSKDNKIGALNYDSDCKDLMSEGQHKAFIAYEKIASTTLKEGEILAVLKGEKFPDFTAEDKAAAVLALVSVPTDLIGSSSVAGLDDLITSKQRDAIKLTEQLNAKRIDKTELEKILAMDDDAAETQITELKLTKLAGDIKAALSGGKSFSELAGPAVAALTDLDQDQRDALTFQNSKETDDILKILKSPKDYKRPTTTEDKIKFIFGLTAGADNPLTDLDKAAYKDVVTDAQITAIKEAETKTSGKRISERALLRIIDPAAADAADAADAAAELNEKIKAVRDLTDSEGKMIGALDLSPHVTDAKRLEAIKVQEKKTNAKISEVTLREILTLGINSSELEKLCKDAPLPDSKEDALVKKIEDILKLTDSDDKMVGGVEDLKTHVTEPKRIEAIKKHESSTKKKIDKDMLRTILTAQGEALEKLAKSDSGNGGDNKSEADRKVAEEAAAKEKRSALITKIKEALKTNNFSDLTKEDLTDEQIKALYSLTNSSTEADIEKALNGTGKASSSNDAELKKIADAIVKALGDKKFNELTEQEQKGLNLSPEYLAALKTANPDKNIDILTILKGVKPKSSDVNSNAGGSTDSEAKDTPFYKTYWFMTLAGVVLVAGIGGGAYMMTHKSEETDL